MGIGERDFGDIYQSFFSVVSPKILIYKDLLAPDMANLGKILSHKDLISKIFQNKDLASN